MGTKWAIKKKSGMERVDSNFSKFLEGEYPDATGTPERTRRIQEDYQKLKTIKRMVDNLLYGKK